jgi:acetyltransferase-like isoleucine patch superfamily enzyme
MPTLLREAFPQYDIGRASYGDGLKIVAWDDKTKLKIGAFCSFAENVKILLGGEHRTDWVTTYPFNPLWGSPIPGHPRTKGDVIIGNDVWIGTEALILSGVRIGDGAVIGARTVVTSNVAPYSVWAGSPMRLIHWRFNDAVAGRLLKLKWWNWSDEKIREFLPLMLDPDIKKFLDVAEAESR